MHPTRKCSSQHSQPLVTLRSLAGTWLPSWYPLATRVADTHPGKNCQVQPSERPFLNVKNTRISRTSCDSAWYNKKTDAECVSPRWSSLSPGGLSRDAGAGPQPLTLSSLLGPLLGLQAGERSLRLEWGSWAAAALLLLWSWAPSAPHFLPSSFEDKTKYSTVLYPVCRGFFFFFSPMDIMYLIKTVPL